MRAKISILTFILSLAACTTLETGSMCVVPDDYFLTNQLIAWNTDYAEVRSDPLDAIAPVTLEHIKQEIEQQLLQQGYQFTEDNDSADMLVSFVVATREKILEGTLSYSDPNCSRYNRQPAFLQTREYVAKEAFLAIDLVSAKSQRALWRGWADKPVTKQDRSNPAPLIHAAITSILAELPTSTVPSS